MSAIKAIKDLKFNYCTIHISSGLEALKAAKKVSGKTKIIGVSILTSLDNKALKEIGYNKDIKKFPKKNYLLTLNFHKKRGRLFLKNS